MATGWIRAVVATVIGVLAQGAPGAATLMPQDGDPVALSGHVLPALSQALPASASAGRASDGAKVPAQVPLTLTIVLRRNDPAGFDRYLAEVYDARSPRFRQFLDPEAVSDRFGPSRDDVAAVEAFFAQRGFTVVARTKNRMTLTVSAPRAAVEQALGVAIGDYALGDRTFYANDSDPRLPPEVAVRIEAVIGLSNLAVPHPAIEKTFKKIQHAFWEICKAWQQINVVFQLNNASAGAAGTPPQPADPCGPEPVVPTARPGGTLAKTMGALAASVPWGDARGNGQKIGILAFDTFTRSDVSDYLALAGYPASLMSRLSQVHVNGGAAPGASQSEVLLDITTIMTIATGAAVVVYDAPFTGNTSFQSVFNAMIADHVSIISNSWAYCENQTTLADVQSIDTIFKTAAASGITVLNATGDTGSTCLNGSPDTITVPAGSPNATAVGGTSLTTGPGGTYVSETWWNGSATTPTTGQGGFGVSRFFARPTYQDGFSPAPMRSIPDVAVNADPLTGPFICQAAAGGCPTGAQFGGTSIAAPIWAALVAVVNEAQGANLGFLNPQLYPLAGTSAFHGPAALGSDFAHVGLGSPNINRIHLALAGKAAGTPVAATSKTIAYVDGYAPAVRTEIARPPADGATPVYVVVALRDAEGNMVSGKTVTLAKTAGGAAVITPASGVTSEANGTVTFTVTSNTPGDAAFTATDTTDGLVLAPLVVPFAVPSAASGGISASPSVVANDGIAATTITVTLRDAQNRPTPGKLITLAQGSGHSVVSGPNPSVTDANGEIRFTATNTVPETVVYTATDVTDGNLPIPGSASVVFSGQANGSCAGSDAPAAAPGYTLTPFVTGQANATFFYSNVNWGCRGGQDIAFAADGAVLATNFLDGSVFRLPPGGGVAGSGSKIATLGPSLFQPVTGKDGKVYVTRGATGGFPTGVLYEIDPVTGATLRTVLSGLACPTALAVDPLSGDLFFDDSCYGAGTDNPSIWRVRNPASASPSLQVYATLPSTPGGWLAFAPDGTLFVPQAVSGGAPVLRITGTDQPQPATQSVVPGLETVYWVTVGEALANGAAKSLIVLNGTTIKLADITTNPPTLTDLIYNGPSSGIVGPDGCLYVGSVAAAYKLAPASGGCGFVTTLPVPAFRLTTTSAAAPQGTAQTLTAAFENLAVPAGTQVFFAIAGANAQTILAPTDAQGRAVATYTGVLTGADTIDAQALVGATTYESNTAKVTWTAGTHTTSMSLNQAPASGTAGVPLALRAQITDVATSPAAPVAGVTITLTLGSASCQAVTDAHGIATCTVTPAGLGSLTLTATFAGNPSYATASERTQVAILTGTPSLAAAPPALDFGNVAVGATSPTLSVRITNAGTAPFALASLGIEGAQAADFARGAGAEACATGTPIPANGGSCVVYVAFTPGAAGARAALLALGDGTAATPFTVALTGNGSGGGGGASVTPAPASLSFGNQTVGTTSGVQTVVLTNTGSAAFALTSVAVTGANAGDFALAPGVNACVAGGTLAAGGGTCALYLAFTPAAIGARNAAVTVADGGAALTVTVPLAGIGVTPSTPIVTAAPSSVDFGSQVVGTTSAARTIVLTNTGSAAFALSSVTIGGTNAAAFALQGGANACVAGGSIAGNGGTCSLYVAFAPTAIGAAAAIARVADAGAGIEVAVPLTGSGTPPATSCVSAPVTGGSATACITGALPTCAFATAAFVPVGSVGVAPPAGVTLPWGLFQFEAAGCGATATVTLTYPATLPLDTQFWKFGPTAAQPAGHWYTLPAAIDGNRLTVTFTDGGAGDSDLAANGTIRDPGGAGYAETPLVQQPIPTLDRWALVLLALLLLAAGGRRFARRG